MFCNLDRVFPINIQPYFGCFQQYYKLILAWASHVIINLCIVCLRVPCFMYSAWNYYRFGLFHLSKLSWLLLAKIWNIGCGLHMVKLFHLQHEYFYWYLSFNSMWRLPVRPMKSSVDWNLNHLKDLMLGKFSKLQGGPLSLSFPLSLPPSVRPSIHPSILPLPLFCSLYVPCVYLVLIHYPCNYLHETSCYRKTQIKKFKAEKTSTIQVKSWLGYFQLAFL